MKNFILLAISICAFFSCQRKVSHEEEIKFYVTVGTIMNRTTQPVNDFIHCVGRAEKNALQHEDGKMDSSYTDTLNHLYKIAIEALDSGINALSDVKEMDVDIKLKENVLTQFKDTKTLMVPGLSDIIKVLSNGARNLTDEQKKYYRKYSERGAELTIKAAEVNKLFDDFQSKYHITSDELKKYGF